MKTILILFTLMMALPSQAANEKRNLAILMMNGSAKIHSLDKELNQKLLADELAHAFQEKNKKKVLLSNECESPRTILSEDNKVEMRFEDCQLTIKKKKENTIVIQYQIKSKLKHGKVKSSTLRKKMLKASII